MFDFDVLEISEASDGEEAEAGIASAVEAMRQRSRGAAVVVQNHRPVGVVTDRAGDVEGIGGAPPRGSFEGGRQRVVGAL